MFLLLLLLLLLVVVASSVVSCVVVACLFARFNASFAFSESFKEGWDGGVERDRVVVAAVP